MSLPKELEAKRDEFKVTIDNYEIALMPRDDLKKLLEQMRGHTFNYAYQETIKYLASLGDGFDEKAVKAYTSGEYADHFEDGEEEALAKECFYLGARWQHEQSKLKYQSHLQMLRDHVKEDSNEIVKLNNIIHKQQAIIETLKEQVNTCFTWLQNTPIDVPEMRRHFKKELAEIEGKNV